MISLNAEARLYKWVDENGQVRYGDHLPPGYNNKKHQELDAQGRVIITKEAGKSPAQIKKERAAVEALKRQQELEKQQAEEKRKKQLAQDRILLLTFNSEDEIFYSRDQRLLVINSKINLLKKSIATYQKKLETLDKQATTQYLSKNQSIPGGLQQKIEQMSKNILSAESNIRASEHKRAEVENNFQRDLTRFRDLKKRQRLQNENRKK